MIGNDAEYKDAVARLAAEEKRLAHYRERLKEAGLSDEEIKRVIDPMEAFRLQFSEEIESHCPRTTQSTNRACPISHQ